jgi:hypothetical protein
VCGPKVTNEDETSADQLGRQKRKEMKLRVTAAVRGKCADSRRLRGGIVVLDGALGAETGAFAFLADADQTFSHRRTMSWVNRDQSIRVGYVSTLTWKYDETAETWSDTYYTASCFHSLN